MHPFEFASKSLDMIREMACEECDEQNTLFVALTANDVDLITYSLGVTTLTAPDLREHSQSLLVRIKELIEVQKLDEGSE
jgi:hypothetical protein